MALLYIDLDGFKQNNDTLGHQCGDVLLQQVAERLLQSLRKSDTVARLGGDEFTVILPRLNIPGQIHVVAERILGSLAAPYCLPLGEGKISASVGVAVFPADGTDANTLLKSADQAMYRAKAAGRNRYFLTSEEQEAAEGGA